MNPHTFETSVIAHCQACGAIHLSTNECEHTHARMSATNENEPRTKNKPETNPEIDHNPNHNP